MSRKENKFGISKANILVHALQSVRSDDQRTALLGCIVKIENILGNGNVAIRFLDKTCTIFEDILYCAKQSEFLPVAEKLWPLLLAVPSPLDRVAIAANASVCDQLNGIQLGNTVEVLHNKAFHVAVVKFMGSVESMGQGHYLGLEFLNRMQGLKTDQYFKTIEAYISVDKIRFVAAFLSKRHSNFDIPIEVELRNPTDYTKDSKINEHVMKEKARVPSQRATRAENELDLIEVIGGSWPGVTDARNAPSDNPVKVTRNKSINPVSHLISSRKVVKTSAKSDGIAGVPTNTDTVTQVHEEGDDRNSNTTYDTPADSSNLSVGTLVEVVTDISDPLYGVIRWVGGDGLAGVELEEDHEYLPLELTDGTHNGQRHFTCANGRALFVPVKQCQKDSRFQDVPAHSNMNSAKMFGKDSPVVPGSIPPLSMPTEDDVLAVCGKYRGIQGHHNSCYLDATLFAMFTYTAVFDSLLFRPRMTNDIALYEEVQRVLREEIVNPLRQNLYVRADRVMKLRTLLEDLSSVSGLTSEEKDPEEFLNSLLAQILKAQPFLKLSSGQEAFYYQLFVEKDEGLALPSVQQLFEQSFLSSDIKLKEVPSCLIIQMPRFGKNFKMYPRILPSQLLDVTDVIENSPRQCTVCGKLAQFECKECFGQCGVGLESTAFCVQCLDTAHCHVKRSSHQPRQLTVPADFAIMSEHCPPPRLYMELFAVVCIETSHYVAFVKCGSGHEAPWCFFDSMADRKGEQNGYNIPEMVACPDVSHWLSDDGAVSRLIHEATPNDKQLPEHAKRLLCDAYICMYQSPDVMMYR